MYCGFTAAVLMLYCGFTTAFFYFFSRGILAACLSDSTVSLWNMDYCIFLFIFRGIYYCIFLFFLRGILAACLSDSTVSLWNMDPSSKDKKDDGSQAASACFTTALPLLALLLLYY